MIYEVVINHLIYVYIITSALRVIVALYLFIIYNRMMQSNFITQYIPSKHDHMGPMWAIGGQIAIWVL